MFDWFMYDDSPSVSDVREMLIRACVQEEGDPCVAMTILRIGGMTQQIARIGGRILCLTEKRRFILRFFFVRLHELWRVNAFLRLRCEWRIIKV